MARRAPATLAIDQNRSAAPVHCDSTELVEVSVWLRHKPQSYFAAAPAAAKTQPAPSATRNAGSAVMIGQSPIARSRSCRC